MKQSKENIERINKVIRHIEQSIDKEMSLEELAQLAFFSPFHFQRMFKKILGETPKQFIKRLRLEEAARIITFHSEQNILEVAIKVGFQSIESFSRAFKDYYAISPDNYKKSSEIERINITQIPYSQNAIVEETKIEISLHNLKSEFEDLQIEIVKRPVQKCVYLQTTMQSSQLIKESFKRIKQWSQARELFTNETTIFGLIKDYPIFTSLDKCRFLTCVSVISQPPTSGLVSFLEIPSSIYATFKVKGSISDIIKASSFIVHSWLAESGYKLKLEPIIQIPQEDPTSSNFNENTYQIFIPIQPE